MADEKKEGSGLPAASGALRGASLLIMLQVVSRAVTFIANQLLLRFLTAQLLGISTQLEVYYLSVLFFARESLRVAIQRQGSSGGSHSSNNRKQDASQHRDSAKARAEAEARDTQAVVNLSYLSIALGVMVALILGGLYRTHVSQETLAVAPNLVPSLHIYGLASVVELLSEPAFVVMQTRLRFGTRATAESIATFARCAVTLGTAVLFARRWGADSSGVLPFALGQLSYGVALLAVYLWYGIALAREEDFSLLPRRLVNSHDNDSKTTALGGKFGDEHLYVMSYFYFPTLSLAGSMISQSVVKHVLTQGDTFLIAAMSTPTDQGVYALANNYGGLAARLLFQPVEESSRSYFSWLLSRPAPMAAPLAPAPPLSSSSGGSEDSADEKRTPSKAKARDSPQAQRKAAALKASSDLTVLLKLYTILSTIVVALGPTAAPLLIALVAGPRWTSAGAGAVLATYVLYIPLLAINGVAEAFVASVATEAEVHLQSAWMGIFTIVFTSAGMFFLRVVHGGARGLVAANAINMICRIAWCGWFIAKYLREAGVPFSIADLRPSALTVGAAAVAREVAARYVAKPTISCVMVSVPAVRDILVDISKLAVLGVALVAAVAYGERQFLRQCFEAAMGSRQIAVATK